jgi:ubiquinone/menaquinone biosynthesis C-methylase UbiE
MARNKEFSFGNDSVAESYNNYLVPVLFESWADKLIEDYQPWSGKHVLDLASGTGVVAKKLAQQVGADGKIIAVDINGNMLALARNKCAQWLDYMEFIVGSANALDIADSTMDVVICQQGFQFFPDKKDACNEIYRVLKKDGKAVFSTWCPVAECGFLEPFVRRLS